MKRKLDREIVDEKFSIVLKYIEDGATITTSFKLANLCGDAFYDHMTEQERLLLKKENKNFREAIK